MSQQLNRLQELYRLRQLARKAAGEASTTKLEGEFLQFSARIPRRTLTVVQPRLYQLRGEERRHVEEALHSAGIPGDAPAIDVSGATGLEFPLDKMSFISPLQLNADHVSNERSHLNGLIEQVYLNGQALLNNFGLHEALIGTVVASRGRLRLDELSLFPERFTPGPYTLAVQLETPENTVRRFRELTGMLDEFEQQPKEALLDGRKLGEAARLAAALRTRLGALTRYENVQQDFAVDVNSYVARQGSTTLFYLYAPQRKKNIIVYFGTSPFKEHQTIDALVLDSSDSNGTLARLVELGIFDISLPVLQQHVKDLDQLYDDATRLASHSLQGAYPELERCIDEMRTAETYFGNVVNHGSRRDYALRLSPGALECMAYPSSDDPTVHALLPRLSWHKPLREYHDTLKFIETFGSAGENGRRQLLDSVTAGIAFHNQQNNDVNEWLYKEHRALCESAGITFEVRSR